MVSEYKPVEEKLIEVVSPYVKKGVEVSGRFLHSLYAGAVGFFRIPTTIRKTLNGQSFFTRHLISIPSENSYPETFGLALALTLPITYLTSSGVGGSEEIEHLLTKIPATTILKIGGLTNFFSLVYEVGRLSKSIGEFHEALNNIKVKEAKFKEKLENRV